MCTHGIELFLQSGVFYRILLTCCQRILLYPTLDKNTELHVYDRKKRLIPQELNLQEGIAWDRHSHGNEDAHTYLPSKTHSFHTSSAQQNCNKRETQPSSTTIALRSRSKWSSRPKCDHGPEAKPSSSQGWGFMQHRSISNPKDFEALWAWVYLIHPRHVVKLSSAQLSSA